MKKIKYIVLLLLVAFFGCEETVDIDPTDIVVGTPDSINSLEAVREVVNSGYTRLNLNPVGIADIASDNAAVASTNTGQGIQVHNWTYNQQNPRGSFLGPYLILRDINVALNALSELNITDADIPTANQLRAEGLTLRAMAHFVAIQYFSPRYVDGSELGMPIVTELVGATETRPRNSLGEVYAQIEEDIAEAISLYPENFSPTGQARDLFTKASTYALGARVALTKGDWETAFNHADMAIDLSGVAIATRAEYPQVWRDESIAGVLFAGLRGETGFESSYNRVTNEDIFYSVSRQLADLHETGDIRGEFNFSEVTIGGQEFIRQEKWPWTNSSQTAIDGKFIRIEEMYLTRAEAAARMNMLGQAAGDINAIRANRITDYMNISYANQQEAIEDVLLERRIELAFEGHRFFDLKRLGLPLNRLAEDCVVSACDLPANDFRFTFPIPQDEMFANPNMVQNQGY